MYFRTIGTTKSYPGIGSKVSGPCRSALDPRACQYFLVAGTSSTKKFSAALNTDLDREGNVMLGQHRRFQQLSQKSVGLCYDSQRVERDYRDTKQSPSTFVVLALLQPCFFRTMVFNTTSNMDMRFFQKRTLSLGGVMTSSATAPHICTTAT